jgi:hypothetical protein
MFENYIFCTFQVLDVSCVDAEDKSALCLYQVSYVELFVLTLVGVAGPLGRRLSLMWPEAMVHMVEFHTTVSQIIRVFWLVKQHVSPWRCIFLSSL